MIRRTDITSTIGKEDISCDRLGSKVLHCIKRLLMTTNDKQLLQILYFTNICYKCCILRTFATNNCILRAFATNVVFYKHLLQILYFTSICYKYCILPAFATNIVFYEHLLQILYFTSICYK